MSWTDYAAEARRADNDAARLYRKARRCEAEAGRDEKFAAERDSYAAFLRRNPEMASEGDSADDSERCAATFRRSAAAERDRAPRYREMARARAADSRDYARMDAERETYLNALLAGEEANR